MEKNDRELEAAFARWRAVERSEAPSFEGLIGTGATVPGTGAVPGRVRRRYIRTAVGASVASAAVVAALWMNAGREDRRFEAALERAVSETQLGSWKGPSDFLMDVPGFEYYASLPVITTGREGREPPSGAPVPPDSQGRRP